VPRATAGKRPSTRRKRLWTKPKRRTISVLERFVPRSSPSRKSCRPKTLIGTRWRGGLRRRYVARETERYQAEEMITAGIPGRYRRSSPEPFGLRPPPRLERGPAADPIEQSRRRGVWHADLSDPSSSHAPRIHEWRWPPIERPSPSLEGLGRGSFLNHRNSLLCEVMNPRNRSAFLQGNCCAQSTCL
jgi:hypothetical protein